MHARVCRLCRYLKNPPMPSRQPLLTCTLLGEPGKRTIHGFDHRSFSSCKSSSVQSTVSSPNSSAQSSSRGLLDQEHTAGYATLISGPSLTNPSFEDDLPVELRSLQSSAEENRLPPRIRITEAAARVSRPTKQL